MKKFLSYEGLTQLVTNVKNLVANSISPVSEAVIAAQAAADAAQETADSKVGAVTITKVNDLQYSLYVDGASAGTIDIPKDQFVKSVSYDTATKTINFVFVTTDGEADVPVDISNLVDTYTNGNGISLSNNKFSVKIDSSSDSYLTVGTGGVKLTGVKTALDTKANASDVYKKSETYAKSEVYAKSQTYTKTECDSTFVADSSTIPEADINTLFA